MLKRLRASATDGQLRQLLACRTAPARRFRIVRDATVGSVEAFWRRLRAETAASADDEAALADPATRASLTRYAANIENMIGTVKLPVGLAGPLRINGTHANGDYLVPLATTEAALVASYARGAESITAAGGG